MAAVETTVSSAHGEVFSLRGRVARDRALDEARKHAQQQVLKWQAHLREVENWHVETHRGTTLVLSFEELEARK